MKNNINNKIDNDSKRLGFFDIIMNRRVDLIIPDAFEFGWYAELSANFST